MLALLAASSLRVFRRRLLTPVLGPCSVVWSLEVLLARGRSVDARTPAGAVAVPSAVVAATSLFLGFHRVSDLVGGTLVGEAAVHLDVRWLARPDRRRAPLAEDSQRCSQAPHRFRGPPSWHQARSAGSAAARRSTP